MTRLTRRNNIAHQLSSPQQQQQTPPGFNKQKRDRAKVCLTLAALLLLTGYSFWAILASATATLILKQGTILSTKNLKWITACIISFIVSLVSWVLYLGQEYIDQDRAYDLKMKYWFASKFLQLVWGGILSLLLISNYMGDSPAAVHTRSPMSFTGLSPNAEANNNMKSQ